MTTHITPFDLRQLYDRIHGTTATSPTLRRIWREAYGDDYPAEADPFGFVTLTELRRLASALSVGPGGTILDLGSGSGGPGLWVAREVGAQLVGIDFSATGVARANERARTAGLADRALFQVGDMTEIDLPDRAFDGALSVDALDLVSDRAAAFREVARLLRPGARFAFTSWELDQPNPVIAAPAVPDYRPLLDAAGLATEVYERVPGWAAKQRAVYAGFVAEHEQLVAEVGQAQADHFAAWGRRGPDRLEHARRVFVVARLVG